MLVTEKKTNIAHQVVTHRFFRSIEAAGADWDAAAPPHDVFLQRPYLSVVQHHPPKGMRFGYLVFYKEETPVGVALCQIKYFRADENIQEPEESAAKSGCFFIGLAQWLKKQFTGFVSADVLICGNLLLTGEHGFYFNPLEIHAEQGIRLLEQALAQVSKLLEKSGIRTPVTLLKDLLPLRSAEGRFLDKAGFVEFKVQPNMTLQLPFADFEAYLAAMSTKYRTRAKRAFKKLEGVEKREMTLHDVRHELTHIYNLYRKIAQNAGFNMVDLNEDYLFALKRDFSPHFRIFGYYKDNALIAYYTAMRNGTSLEAHFLGYEQSLNHDLQLYLNMLYDLVRLGLETNCEELVFARTALEIKSSVGAEPHDLLCYLRHNNAFANRFAEPLIDYLNPIEVWEQRHPFKS